MSEIELQSYWNQHKERIVSDYLIYDQNSRAVKEERIFAISPKEMAEIINCVIKNPITKTSQLILMKEMNRLCIQRIVNHYNLFKALLESTTI